MSRLARLPIGVSSFEVLRSRQNVYVDKTEYIYRLVDEGMYYFLSRPRRFGKSLLISTLRCLFEGKEKLFQGLWLATHSDWEWQEYPVVLLDFNQISHDTPQNLELSLHRELQNMARHYQVKLDEPLLKGQFKELILNLHQISQQPVVILIDEYDKPILDHLGQGEARLQIAAANRDILKHFFGVLKGGDVMDVLRLVFITGISRFSRVSIFSELNNLSDITFHQKYATLLGYTQAELERDFAAHLEHFAHSLDISLPALLARIKDYYDGYRFAKKALSVYNPFSTLKALDALDFGYYWFETGTPTFLINLLQETDYPLTQIDNMYVPVSIFSTFDIHDLQPEAVLFQSGYVTIQAVQDKLYQLGYPNKEVKTALSELLVYSFAQRNKRQVGAHIQRLGWYLQREDSAAFFETMTAIFASIPYDIQTKRDEAYYHSLFYLIISAAGGGAAVHSSVLTSRGRIDMVVELPDKVYIIEFKCQQSAQVALKQIQDQGYAEPYRQTGKQIILMGINFSAEKRNLEELIIIAGTRTQHFPLA